MQAVLLCAWRRQTLPGEGPLEARYRQYGVLHRAWRRKTLPARGAQGSSNRRQPTLPGTPGYVVAGVRWERGREGELATHTGALKMAATTTKRAMAVWCGATAYCSCIAASVSNVVHSSMRLWTRYLSATMPHTGPAKKPTAGVTCSTLVVSARDGTRGRQYQSTAPSMRPWPSPGA